MVSPRISRSGREGRARQDEKRNILIVSALIRAPTQPRPLSCIALAAARNSFSRSPMSVYMPSTSNRHTPSCLRSGIKVLKPSVPGFLGVYLSFLCTANTAGLWVSSPTATVTFATDMIQERWSKLKHLVQDLHYFIIQLGLFSHCQLYFSKLFFSIDYMLLACVPLCLKSWVDLFYGFWKHVSDNGVWWRWGSW